MSTPKKGAQASKAKAAGSAAEAIRVVPKIAGFRRAGYDFPAEGRTIVLADLTAEQLEQLENEPMLVTHRVGAEPPAADALAAETGSEQPAA